MKLEWIIPIVIILLVIIRVKKRGFFWKAKDGRELTFKQFLGSWKKGINGITPLQQTMTTLWSYPLVLGGIISGLIIMGLRGEWWLVLILGGSLPITLMAILSTWQKYRQQRRIYETMNELESQQQNEGICVCGHHSKDHSYIPKSKDNKLKCDKCECENYEFKKKWKKIN